MLEDTGVADGGIVEEEDHFRRTSAADGKREENRDSFVKFSRSFLTKSRGFRELRELSPSLRGLEERRGADAQ